MDGVMLYTIVVYVNVYPVCMYTPGFTAVVLLAGTLSISLVNQCLLYLFSMCYLINRLWESPDLSL